MNRKKIPLLLLAICVMLALCACRSGTGGNGETLTDLLGTTQGVQVTYVVKVMDESGNPIPNVMVQLCKDSCFPAVTNADGVAQFSVAKDAYKASVTAMPEGYQADAREFYFEDGATELTITLRPAA